MTSTTSDPSSGLGLAARMRSVEGSGVRKMFDLITSMQDPINLSIGQAHYDAPESVKDAAIDAIRAGHNRYTVTEGVPELREGVLARLEREHGHRPEAVLLTSGVSGGLLLAAMALLDPGDTVLLPDPFFVMYKNALALVGAEARYYDLYPREGKPGFAPDAQEIASLVTSRTKLVLVNSPSNPTGGVFDAGALDALVAACARTGTWILADEIYSHFAYDAPYASMVARMPAYERVCVLGGFSKTWGVPGWRLGWAVGPGELCDAMKLLQQYTYVCPPAPLQLGALAALTTDMGAERDAYRRKRDAVVAGLCEHYELVAPAGSFYAFPRYPAGMSEAVFVETCLSRNLLIVGGSAFSRRGTNFRLSFAADDAMLQKGLEVLREIAEMAAEA